MKRWGTRKNKAHSCCSKPLNRIKSITVVLIWESKWLDLWSKWHIFDLVFYNIRMPPCSGPLGSILQLTEALKWGTVGTSSSTGTEIMKGVEHLFSIK